jgi:hypothetical protein
VAPPAVNVVDVLTQMATSGVSVTEGFALTVMFNTVNPVVLEQPVLSATDDKVMV